MRESRFPILALSLFLVLVLAKALTLVGRDVPLSPWSIPAYVWQDALVVLIFGLLEWIAFRRRWVSRVLYGGIVIYAAANVPLVRILSSPFTWRMSQATGGAMADSIAHYFSLGTAGCVVAVVTAAVAFPWVLRRVSCRTAWGLSGAALVFAALGPVASSRVDTIGLERNAIAAFLRSAMPRVTATARVSATDWRRSTMDSEARTDLSTFRGSAAGRNVVLILLESTGAQYLKLYGADTEPMPTLSRLAEKSILFENAYAVYPESIKGLFSVLCSRFPAFDTAPEDYARVRTPAIAEVLKAAGYRTALFHSGRFAYLGMPSIIRERGFELLEDAGMIGGNVESSFGVDEPATVERMLAWIDALPRSDRFFLTYLPIAGHHPYESPGPRPFTGRDNGELHHYLNALHYGDQALGQFLDGLTSRGLDTNTLFVILGDHGEAFGQHEGNYGHTLFIYEENLRVPCLLAAPGLLHEQIRVANVASVIDTAPTIAELLGLTVPADWQGGSWLDGESRMALFFTDYSLGLLGLRDGPWKFIYELESGRSRLFHLDEDPTESLNRATEHLGRSAVYRDRLQRWSAEQKARILRPNAPVTLAGTVR